MSRLDFLRRTFSQLLSIVAPALKYCYCSLFANVSLWSILNANVSQLEWDFSLVQKQATSISATVHDINLRDASDSPLSVDINFPSQMKHFVVGDILISWNYAQDNSAGLLHILLYHLGGHLKNVLVLAVYRNARQPRQINNCKVGAIRRVNIQNYWPVNYVLAISAHFLSQEFDAFLDLSEIGHFFRQLGELSVWLFQIFLVHHPDLEWSPRDNSLHDCTSTEPLGRKSSPTICSTSELLPELWLPTATILGSLI